MNGFQFVVAHLSGRCAAKFAFKFRIGWLAEAGGGVGGRAAILTCVGHGCSPLVGLCAQTDAKQWALAGLGCARRPGFQDAALRLDRLPVVRVGRPAD